MALRVPQKLQVNSVYVGYIDLYPLIIAQPLLPIFSKSKDYVLLNFCTIFMPFDKLPTSDFPKSIGDPTPRHTLKSSHDIIISTSYTNQKAIDQKA